MEKSFFEWQDKNWATHWWYTNRIRLFKRELQQAGINLTSHVLDIGTASGNDLQMLMEAGFTNVEGIEPDIDAISFCRYKGFSRITQGSLPEMPFEDSSFDLVVATDILEHVDNDALGVREIARVLKPGGRVLITVPAFQSMWGLQDTISLHKRRYRREELLELCKRNGIDIDTSDCFYFNYILFLPIFIARKILNLMNGLKKNTVKNEGHINNPLLNALFDRIFYLDILTARSLKVPFGVSLFALGRKAYQQDLH